MLDAAGGAVGQRRLARHVDDGAGPDALGHRRRGRWRAGDDLDRRPFGADVGGDAADQTAAAEGEISAFELPATPPMQSGNFVSEQAALLLHVQWGGFRFRLPFRFRPGFGFLRGFGCRIEIANRLDPCRPNPFNPATNLRLTLPTAGDLEVRVHDLQAEVVPAHREMGITGTYTCTPQLCGSVPPKGSHIVSVESSSTG